MAALTATADRTRQRGAAAELERREREIHIAVLDRLLELAAARPSPPDPARRYAGVDPTLSWGLAERMRARADFALAARWLACPTDRPLTSSERDERLLRAVALLIEARDYDQALSLARLRLAGSYDAATEARHLGPQGEAATAPDVSNP